MATISDVAKKAGVGTTTVSRVLNNSLRVSDETKSKVISAMKELNYVPNASARGLASSSSLTIGLVMDNTIDKAYANPFVYEMFRGIEKSIYEGGFNLLLLGKSTMQNNKLSVENVLIGKLVDGLILYSDILDPDYYKIISNHKIPIVVTGALDTSKYNVSTVDIDNVQAGYCASEYLFKRGYRKIGFAGIDKDKKFAEDRYQGYISFLKENNLDEIKEEEIFKKADSIICLDNIWAYKVLQKCRELNIKVPDEISLITFDNYPLAEYLEPSITNVEIDLYQLGVEAGREILRKVKERKEDSRHIKIKPSINIRLSTK